MLVISPQYSLVVPYAYIIKNSFHVIFYLNRQLVLNREEVCFKSSKLGVKRNGVCYQRQDSNSEKYELRFLCQKLKKKTCFFYYTGQCVA